VGCDGDEKGYLSNGGGQEHVNGPQISHAKTTRVINTLEQEMGDFLTLFTRQAVVDYFPVHLSRRIKEIQFMHDHDLLSLLSQLDRFFDFATIARIRPAGISI